MFRCVRLVRWNDFDVENPGIEGIPGNGVFQRLLVLQLDGLRNDEILPVGSQLGFGAGYVERGHSADLELLFVVVEKLFRDGHCLLLHLHVFPRVHEFPVGGDCICGSGDGLLRKGEVGDLSIIFCDEDVAAIYREAEAAE